MVWSALHVLVVLLALVVLAMVAAMLSLEVGLIEIHWDGEVVSNHHHHQHQHQQQKGKIGPVHHMFKQRHNTVPDTSSSSSPLPPSPQAPLPPPSLAKPPPPTPRPTTTTTTTVTAATGSSSSKGGGGGRRVIVFSMFDSSGNGRPNEYFVSGLIHNLALARVIYPEWQVRIYCGSDVKPEFVKLFRDCGADVRIQPFDKMKWMDGMFWRFYPADDRTIERFIVRDVDGRLNWRERVAVDKWIRAGTAFHSIKDHPLHSIHVMGGMWGAVGGMLRYAKAAPGTTAATAATKTMKQMCDDFRQKTSKGADQTFLSKHIYGIMRHNLTEHNSQKANFAPECDGPTKDYTGYYFVGAAYGKDRVHNTLDCAQRPKCYHVCRWYQAEFMDMTGKEFPVSLYGPYNVSGKPKCQWIDCARPDTKC